MADIAPSADQGPSGHRIGRLALILGLVLAVAAIAAFLLATTRQDATYAPDSAEAAFQRYLAAWDRGDVETAYAALSTRARTHLPLWEFREAQSWSGDQPARVWIAERRDFGERVVLKLTIEQSYEGLLGPSRYHDQPSVTLVREHGVWVIDTPLVGYHIW
jgi:hypothetical protein